MPAKTASKDAEMHKHDGWMNQNITIPEAPALRWYEQSTNETNTGNVVTTQLTSDHGASSEQNLMKRNMTKQS
jgi:hypothetical protein